MKRIFLLIVLLLPILVSAQIEFKPGIKTGLNLANITNSNFNIKSDFYAGAFVSINFADFYHLQPEIVYSRQGGKSSFDDFKLELNYLSIAIANKFYLPKDSGFHVTVGPSFDFRTKSSVRADSEKYEGFDFAFFGGLGYEFPFGLGVELRYKQGIVDILGRNVNDTVSFSELIANKVIQIGVNYQFDL